jgi:two-component system, OmpR family, phosphate regulon sensor histidine kinase PhoR
MKKKRLLWQLFPSYLLITLLALIAIAWYSTHSLREFYYQTTRNDLIARARLFCDMIKDFDPILEREKIDAVCKESGMHSLTRVTVVLKNGLVIGESDEEPSRMDDHSSRPEIETALETGEVGTSRRSSPTVHERMMYVAVPLYRDDAIIGVVRTSVSISSIDAALSGIHVQIFIVGMIIAIISALLSLIVSRRISRPLEEMKRVAVQYAQGNLDYRLPVLNSEEIGGLAEALNQMALQLNDRIRTVMQQKNEQEAILRSMVEGVLAIDKDERIISLNHAMITLFSVRTHDYEGRTLHEIVRNKDLHAFVHQALESSAPVEGELVIRDGDGTFLQASGTALYNADGEKIGAVIAVNDVTRVRRLENLRRDFVANVSHELKTPITAIKGFVETLQDGAVRNPDDAQKFLAIITRHVNRLTAIIDDLLSLSRIEQNKEKEKIALALVKVRRVIESAREICEPKARQKNIRFTVDCDEELTAFINEPLLEQALVNLLDNAVKYSDEGDAVQIEAEDQDASVVIHVHDHGSGIEEEHFPRIFERFYRIDKARSRKLGGTGLGLAIVKHIAQAHGGQITVNSIVNVGSSFSIHLPKVK